MVAVAVAAAVVLVGASSGHADNQPPTSILTPTVSGDTTAVGNVLTGSPGTWSGSPTLAYQWQRCDPLSFSSCTAITGATSTTYTIAAADIGKVLFFYVTATNAYGSATSNGGTATVGPIPTLISEPSVSGSVTAGSTLTVSPGTWTNAPTSYAYSWQACVSTNDHSWSCNGPPISATQTYTLAASDFGPNRLLMATVTATNATGTASAVSPAVYLYSASDPQTAWVGPCDSGRWDAAAAARGWTGAGAHPLGASYLGVPVCGPRPATDGSPDVAAPDTGALEWECTELAFRFMAKIYGVHSYGAPGGDVVRNYQTVYGGNLVVVDNGTQGAAPQPGDVISFDGTYPGHVAVVANSQVDASGNGRILLLSQNDYPDDGWHVLSVSNWTVEAMGPDRVPYAWLHDPAGRGDPPGTVLPAFPSTATSGGGGSGGSGGGGSSTGSSGSGGGGGNGSIPNLGVSIAPSASQVGPGGTVSVAVAVPNTGLSTLGVHLLITLPAGASLLAPPTVTTGTGCTGTQTIDCNLDYIAGGASSRVAFAITLANAGDATITATATAAKDSDPSNNSASVTVHVVAPPTSAPASPPTSTPHAPSPAWWTSCAVLNRKYRHGVGKVGARDKRSARPVTNFLRNTAAYKLAVSHNARLDGDHDGIACEKR